jgi:hypothetical protein
MKVFWFFSSEKNRKLSMFFSEEKNQKTFASARVRRYGTWPDGGEAGV